MRLFRHMQGNGPSKMGRRCRMRGEEGAGQGRGFRGRHRGRFGGGGRVLGHGELRFLLLALIAEKPRHGYDLIKAIEEKVAGAYSPSPGVIYPTLTLLEDMGWVKATPSDDAKKLFAVTDEGKLALAANKTVIDGILARLEEVRLSVADTSGDADAGDRRDMRDFVANTGGHFRRLPLMRDFRGLRRALRAKLTGDALSDEQIETIASALREAAAKIEGA